MNQEFGKMKIFLLPLLLLFVCLALMGCKREEEHRVEIVYTVHVCEKRLSREGISASIPMGAEVFSGNGTLSLGKVISLEFEEHLVPGVKDGEVVLVARTDHSDCRIRVRADATRSQKEGLRVSGIRIAAGGKGAFCIGNCFFENGEVISVEYSEENA